MTSSQSIHLSWSFAHMLKMMMCDQSLYDIIVNDTFITLIDRIVEHANSAPHILHFRLSVSRLRMWSENQKLCHSSGEYRQRLIVEAKNTMYPLRHYRRIYSPVICNNLNCKNIKLDNFVDLQAKLHQCSACHMVKYCSKSCQKEHWKFIHQYICKTLRHTHY